MKSTQKEGMGALIVIYFPQLEILRQLIQILRPQVSKLYLICNGIEHHARAVLEQESQYSTLTFLDNNPGLGKALNLGMQLALDDQIELLFLFDQDSTPPPNFVVQMEEQLEQAKTLAKKNGSRSKIVAAIGPSFYDARSDDINNTRRNQFKIDGRPQINDEFSGNPIACDCLITSGMLLNLKQIFPPIFFDETYFVDHVDSEWCFRVRSLGYQIYGSTVVSMGHRISDSKAIHFGKLTFLSYSPIRRYWHYKNSVRLIKSPNTNWGWKMRIGGILLISFIPNLVLDQNSLQSATSMASGLWDGILESK